VVTEDAIRRWNPAPVLRSYRERFAFGALVAGFLLLAGLHVLNPDALIVRTNVSHAQAGHRFDAGYAASLSADAVPALVAGMAKLSPAERSEAATRILAEWFPPIYADWRAWNWSRREARRVTEENRARLLCWKAGRRCESGD
jgi:hypothetical protein